MKSDARLLAGLVPADLYRWPEFDAESSDILTDLLLAGAAPSFIEGMRDVLNEYGCLRSAANIMEPLESWAARFAMRVIAVGALGEWLALRHGADYQPAAVLTDRVGAWGGVAPAQPRRDPAFIPSPHAGLVLPDGRPVMLIGLDPPGEYDDPDATKPTGFTEAANAIGTRALATWAATGTGPRRFTPSCDAELAGAEAALRRAQAGG